MNPIVGIGEVLWDVYPDGRKVAGGAPFNFAFHCHQLGHPAVIASRVGADDLGRELRARVRELGLSDEYIQTDPDHATGTVQVKLGADAVPTYTITENVAWDHIAWDDRLAELAGSCRAVCFGTLASRTGHSRATIQRFLSPWEAGDPQLIVYDVNLRSEDVPEFVTWGIGSADWLKVNSAELERVGNWCGDITATVRDTFSQTQTVIVTRGEGGCRVIAGDDIVDVPGVPANVVDTVGAGDAFTAAMVCLHLEGKSLRDCARFAVHYAARVCEHPGGTPKVSRAEVERAAGLSP
jgi:fructokinase